MTALYQNEKYRQVNLTRHLTVLLALAAASSVQAAEPVAMAAKPAAKSSKAAQVPQALVTISKETTYITQPLRADDYPDYVAALNERCSKGATPENNAAVPFWKAMGPAEINEKIRDKYFKMLGIPPLPVEGDYYVSLDNYAKRVQPAKSGNAEPDASAQQKRWDDQRDAMRRPWAKQEFPLLAGWLTANDKPMSLLVEASKRSRRYEPLLTADEPSMLIAVLLPGQQLTREAVRALTARAMLRLGAGEGDKAWADIMACHRLARLTGQGPTLIDGLVAFAIDGIALAGDQAILQHAALTSEQARRMYDDLATLSPVCNMSDAIDRGERFMFLDAVCYLARDGVLDTLAQLSGDGDRGSQLEKILARMAWAAVDWDVCLRMGNAWYDRTVDAYRRPVRADQKQAIEKLDEDIRKLLSTNRNAAFSLALDVLGGREAMSEHFGKILVALMLPALNNAGEAADRSTMQGEVTRLGFALAAYKADRGTYPEKLAELSPKYAAKIPIDIFSGGELKYRLEGKGYILYSVGRNGKDDGGRGYDDHDETAESQDWDDLVVRVPARERPKKQE